MATLNEYHEMDFGHTLKISGSFQTIFNGKNYELKGYLSYDFTANCIFTSYYFEDKNLTVDFFVNFLKSISEKWEWNFGQELKLPRASLMKGLRLSIGNFNPLVIKAQFPGEEQMDMAEVGFHGRIFLYSETQLSTTEISQIRNYGRTLNFNIQYRSIEFSRQRSVEEKPLAFISHDSRDKDNIARPIAIKLQQNDCPVWYDEYTLKIGDNLRESIESGIKDCKKCILILTPNFIKNGGWTKTEFNSIFTRQILEEEKLILPVWSGIDKSEVYEYSPSLLNIVGIQWSTGIDNVVLQLSQVITGSQY
jgi:TIR domain